jgi:hypothetical protein
LRVDFQGSRVASDGGLLHDVTAFFSPHAERRVRSSSLGWEERPDEERVTVSFRDLRAVAWLAIVGSKSHPP